MQLSFIETIELIDRLHGSERQVYVVINLLKDLGAPVAYCQLRKSYYYENEVEFQRNLFLDKNDSDQIKGGENFLQNFWALQDFCSGRG
jgi:hypothetical protein